MSYSAWNEKKKKFEMVRKEPDSMWDRDTTHPERRLYTVDSRLYIAHTWNSQAGSDQDGPVYEIHMPNACGHLIFNRLELRYSHRYRGLQVTLLWENYPDHKLVVAGHLWYNFNNSKLSMAGTCYETGVTIKHAQCTLGDEMFEGFCKTLFEIWKQTTIVQAARHWRDPCTISYSPRTAASPMPALSRCGS